jgi:hypothetical protein
MRLPAVQRLLLDVAAAPRDRAFFETALNGAGVSPDQFQGPGLIRRDGNEYGLAFSRRTRADRQRILAVAEREGTRLAAEILARRSRIEVLLRNGSMPTADWRATAFFVLGCASLDWDGPNLASKRGYLAVADEVVVEAAE